MALKPKADKRGQLIGQGLMSLTPVQEAIKNVLIKEYDRSKGNISLTARASGLSRPTTLKLLRAYELYDKYPHKQVRKQS